MRLRTAWTLALGAVLVACAAGLPSRVDRNWGSAQHDNTAAMIVSPLGTDPEHDPGAVSDGETIEDVLGGFRAEQRRGGAPSRPPSVINIGTVSR
jgi:hypothetical protein